MTQASERPRRKRLSWESRCEVVAAIEEGVSPLLAAASGGCSRATAYRLWRRYCEGGYRTGVPQAAGGASAEPPVWFATWTNVSPAASCCFVLPP